MTLRAMLDSPWTYFAGAGLLALVAVATQFELRTPSRDVEGPEAISLLKERQDLNVVFVVIDTLRADRLGVYGYGRPTSATLDALARTGVVFSRAVAQSSWTKTSMASLWTGTNPASHGILRFNHAVPEQARMPAEILKEAGFKTAGIWRNGWVSPNFGFGQGFDVYVRPKAGRERERMQQRHPGTPRLRGTDEDIAESAVEFLDTVGDERFLLYLHFMDVHQYIFDEAASIFGTSYSDAYDQSIHWIDRVLGFVAANLEERDLLERTLIVVTSDHGEEFREHGGEGHARHLHQEVLGVPLIFVLPFRLEPGLVVDEVVSNVDVWPTILDLLGLPPLPGADGVSLVPLMLAAAGESVAAPGLPRPVFSQLDSRWGQPTQESDPLIAVTDGSSRLMMRLDEPESVRLYDLARDPLETRDLAEGEPASAEPMKALVAEYLSSSRNPWEVGPAEVELTEMRLDQLRALGYVIR